LFSKRAKKSKSGYFAVEGDDIAVEFEKRVAEYINSHSQKNSVKLLNNEVLPIWKDVLNEYGVNEDDSLHDDDFINPVRKLISLIVT
jgi:hypothetical protein